VSYIGRCTKHLYYDIYREGWGKGDLPSREVDYDGEFLLSPTTVGELALMIYLMHQPGQHMCLRRFKKLLYLSMQDASNNMMGGMLAMGRRVVVHSSRYRPEVQLLKSTPKEMVALEEALALAVSEYERVRRVFSCSHEEGRRRWFQLVLEGKAEVGAENIPELQVPASSTVDRFEESDVSAICILGDNTAAVGAGIKGTSSHPAMQRCCDRIMVSCVKADFAPIIYYLTGKDMEMNGIDNISRGKTEGTRMLREVGLNVTADPIMNPFARQDWGLPEWIRDLLTKRFGNDVKFFACGLGLTAENCANDVVVIYPALSTALSLLDHACEVLDLCRYSMTLVMVCVKDCATRHMRSMLRRFDRQSNGQNAVLLPAGPGDVWARYLAVKLPEARPLITNQIIYRYCNDLADVEGDRAKMSEVLSSWMARYGKAAVESERCEAAGVAEALGDCECDVSELNQAIQAGVLIKEGPREKDPLVGMSSYRPLVVRSKKGAASAWGVSSEMRLSRRKTGHIVQHVTEIWTPGGAGRTIVQRYTQAWKVFRLGSTMRTVAKGKCTLVLKVHDLTTAGSRLYRLKVFFVTGAAPGVEWATKKGGVAWNPGHVLEPARGQQVLCRVLKAEWGTSRIPVFTGTTYVRRTWAPPLSEQTLRVEVSDTSATRGGDAKLVKPPVEPQGADLMRAAGLGQDPRFRRVAPMSSVGLGGVHCANP
jgi:hypothetical protein